MGGECLVGGRRMFGGWEGNVWWVGGECLVGGRRILGGREGNVW